MSAHDLSAVRDFFIEFDNVQLETWNLKLQPDAGRVATLRQEMKLDGYVEGKAGDMVKVLARPGRPDNAWFEQHSARSVGNRTIYAIQPVTVGGTAMALVYTNSFERNELGMNERYGVADVGGKLQVVSRESHSTEHGWRHAGGQKTGSVKSAGETEKLEAPTHAGTRALYDAL